MAEVELKVVLGAEALSKDRFWHEGADVVVISSMLAMESSSRRLNSLGSDLELQDDLLAFVGTSKEEALLTVAAMH